MLQFREVHADSTWLPVVVPMRYVTSDPSANIEETNLKPEVEDSGQNKTVPSRKSVNINIEIPSSNKQRTRGKRVTVPENEK